MKEELTEPLCYTKRWLMTDFRVMGELSFSVVNMKYSHMKTTRKRKNHTPGNNNTRQKKKQKMWKLVSRQEEQRRTREAHRQHRKFFTTSKRTHRETILQLKVKDKRKGRLPLDALEGAAGHVHDATCRSSDHAHQAFTNALKETCCSFLLRPCRDIIQTTIRFVLLWFNSGFTMFLLQDWTS